MSDRIPAPRASRPSVGLRARTAATPLTGAELDAAHGVALSAADAATLGSIVAALPDPDDLEPGTLVVLPAEITQAKSLARSVLAVFGRTKTIPRTRRCSALVARGYVDVGAAEGEDGDFAWGRVPPRSSSEVASLET